MTTPICTVAEFKVYSGITGTNQDALIIELTPSVLNAMGSLCSTVFTSRTIVAFRDGNDSSGLMLAQTPVSDIASVIIDGQAIPKSTDGIQPGYLLTGRRIVLRGYKFTRGDRNVKIIYTAGYGDASGPANADLCPWPEDLKLAFMMTLKTRIGERERLGVGSKSLAGESVTYSEASSGKKGIPSYALAILEGYMNVVPESDE